MFRLVNWYFLFLIPFIIYIFFKPKKKNKIKFSSIILLKQAGLKKSNKHKIGRTFIVFALIMLTIALARPQLGEELRTYSQEGIDIAIALDVSGSMRSVDFEPNRLEVAKDIIYNFIQKRPNDRFSLIIFAGEAYTVIPLTLDHSLIKTSLKAISTDDVSRDGTAIGMGMAVAINRLKSSIADSKVMILVTDGENNTGEISPVTATQLAKDMNIRVHTIGVGSDRTIIPVQVFGQTQYREFDEGIDEELLTYIATETGGEFFMAEDPDSLLNILQIIDELEKTELTEDRYYDYQELAFGFIKIGLLLLLLGIFLDKYYFIKIP